eukprot:TRINITY_DN3579_c0_g1_i1.p2 TRINITY_DN3579_c0_g1~~TRINITY_DN3579_c0_g1_i1.p2  ORF type:complete len:601 (-),score=106.54 TRINITY_DN3579_c0_g1_i1:352-2154(-)
MEFCLEVFVGELEHRLRKSDPDILFRFLHFQPLLVSYSRSDTGSGSSTFEGRRCTFEMPVADLNAALAKGCLSIFLVTPLSAQQVKVHGSCSLSTAQLVQPFHSRANDGNSLASSSRRWGDVAQKVQIRDASGAIAASARLIVSLTSLGIGALRSTIVRADMQLPQQHPQQHEQQQQQHQQQKQKQFSPAHAATARETSDITAGGSTGVAPTAPGGGTAAGAAAAANAVERGTATMVLHIGEETQMPPADCAQVAPHQRTQEDHKACMSLDTASHTCTAEAGASTGPEQCSSAPATTPDAAGTSIRAPCSPAPELADLSGSHIGAAVESNTGEEPLPSATAAVVPAPLQNAASRRQQIVPVAAHDNGASCVTPASAGHDSDQCLGPKEEPPALFLYQGQLDRSRQHGYDPACDLEAHHSPSTYIPSSARRPGRSAAARKSDRKDSSGRKQRMQRSHGGRGGGCGGGGGAHDVGGERQDCKEALRPVLTLQQEEALMLWYSQSVHAAAHAPAASAQTDAVASTPVSSATFSAHVGATAVVNNDGRSRCMSPSKLSRPASHAQQLQQADQFRPPADMPAAKVLVTWPDILRAASRTMPTAHQ